MITKQFSVQYPQAIARLHDETVRARPFCGMCSAAYCCKANTGTSGWCPWHLENPPVKG